MRVNVIFEGGGILGISFIGAYKALCDRGYHIDQCLGISAGSIVSSLIMAGYSANELIELLNVTNFKALLCETKLSQKSIIGKPMSVVYNKGIYDSEVIEKWINTLLLKKGKKAFRDIMNTVNSPLKIICANINKRERLIIPDDLSKYGINPYDFSIAKAVRMSCAIPFFYTPVKLHYRDKIDYIVDGGIIKNIPCSILTKNTIFKWPTIRFRILTNNRILDGLSNELLFDSKEEEYTDTKEELITIKNQTNIKATNFKVSEGEVELLFRQGYYATIRYLDSKNH